MTSPALTAPLRDQTEAAADIMRTALQQIGCGSRDPYAREIADKALKDMSTLVGGGRPKRGSCGCHVMCDACEGRL